MTFREMQNNLELKCMAVLCLAIDLAGWVFGLFYKPCSEKVTNDIQEDDFDFTFDFDTNDHISHF